MKFPSFKKKSTMELVHGGTASSAEPPNEPKKQKEKKPGLPWKQRLKSKGFLGGCCIVAAAILSFVVTPALAAQKAATVQIVTLSADVVQGEQLTAGKLVMREMGKLNLPAGAMTDLAQAEGMYMTKNALEGDILTSRHIQPDYPTDDPELLSLNGRLAMSVSLTDLAQTVSSKLRAGDVVQLFAVFDDSVEAQKNYTASIIPELQAVEVLMVTNSDAADVSDQDETTTEGTDRQIATLVLSVDRRQAAVLAGLNTKATLHAALVIRGDDAVKQSLLAQQAALLADEGGETK